MEMKGENQVSLSKAVGVQRQSISNYTTGQSKPDTEKLQKICLALDVSADWLIGLSDDPSRTPSAVDDLGLSPDAISAIIKYGNHINQLQPDIPEDMMRIFSTLVASPKFWILVDQIRTVAKLPTVPDTPKQVDEFVETIHLDIALKEKYGGKYQVVSSNVYKEFLIQQIYNLFMKLVGDFIKSQEEKEVNNGEHHTD